MAEPPTPDFSSFDDWLIDGPAGEWRDFDALDKGLSEKQTLCIARNAALLLNEKKWSGIVSLFEEKLSEISDEIIRELTRSNYAIRFDRHNFEGGDRDFSFYKFPCSVSFAEAKFGNGKLSFEGAQFEKGKICFDSAKLGSVKAGSGPVSFSNTKFGGGNVTFRQCSFGNGSLSFSGAKFGHGNVIFDRANFGRGIVSFIGADFGQGQLSFSFSNFGDGNVLFDNAVSGEGSVAFDNVNFGVGAVSFDSMHFGQGNVLFDDATFGEGTVSFDGAQIDNGDLCFPRVNFGDGDVFLVDMLLGTSEFHLSRALVGGNLHVRIDFPKVADFNALEVKGTASFSGSSFKKVPDFRDAKFDRPPDVAGMKVKRPALGWSTLAKDPDDVAKFRKLKAMALAANDHEKDSEFFAGEMLAKRGTETTGLFGLLFNTIYWWLGDFGQSFVRPLAWLGISFLNFAAACLYLIRDTLTLADRFWFAADYSFRNMLPLFGSLFRFAVAPKDHVSWYQKTYEKLATAGVDIDRLISLGIAQNLIGTVLLFLFLLALRNKYRLK